jgi:hypothetical protein
MQVSKWKTIGSLLLFLSCIINYRLFPSIYSNDLTSTADYSNIAKMANFTLINKLAFVLALFPIVSFAIIVGFQYKSLLVDTFRLQVLNTRTAFYLPFYGLIMFISLLIPEAYTALQIPITFFEGYSFYCFLAMIVFNMGGPSQTIAAMRVSGKSYFCCGACCPLELAAFYKKTTWAVFHLVFSRTVISIIIAGVFYTIGESKLGKMLLGLLGVINVALVFYGVFHLVLLCKNIISLLLFVCRLF